MADRRPWSFGAWLGGIALAGVLARVAFVLVLRPDLETSFDPTLYHLLGVNLADGLGFVRPPQWAGGDIVPTAEFGPVLPTLLALATTVGLSTPTQHALVTAVLGGVTIAVIGLLGRRLAGPPVGLVAAAVVGFHPLLVQLDGALATESPYLLLVATLLLATARAWDGPSPGRWITAGLVGGVAMLTRSEAAALVAVVVVPAALLRAGAGWRARLAAATLPVLAAAAVVTPWTIRNWATFDRFVPLSNNIGSVMLGAHCDTTYSGDRAGGWDFSCIAAYAGDDPRNRITAGSNEAVVYGRWRAEGVRYATSHPGAWLRSTPARLARTWGLYWHPDDQLDYDLGEGRHRGLQIAGYLVALLLLPLAFAGARRLVRCGGDRRPLLLLFALGPAVVSSLVSAIGYGTTRFRTGAEPMIAVLAAATIVALVDRRRGRGVELTGRRRGGGRTTASPARVAPPPGR